MLFWVKTRYGIIRNKILSIINHRHPRSFEPLSFVVVFSLTLLNIEYHTFNMIMSYFNRIISRNSNIFDMQQVMRISDRNTMAALVGGGVSSRANNARIGRENSTLPSRSLYHTLLSQRKQKLINHGQANQNYHCPTN